MNTSRSRLPKPILAAFLVLLVLAALVTWLRESPDTGKSRAASSEAASPPLQQDEPPSRAVLRETRKEGSIFTCTVVGRIEGTIRQTNELEAYHPIFKGDIKSRWITPWTVRFRAEVLTNDGATIKERRTFEEVRAVELMAPAELVEMTYDLDPKVNKLITRLASRLQQAYPGNPASQAMGTLIKGQDFNYAEIAKLTGMDEKILARGQTTVAGAARILDDFEGKSIEVMLKDGKTEWIYSRDLPKSVTRTLGRVNSLIDYSALPNPSLAVGERTVLCDLLLNELLPPELINDVLGDFDTSLTLELTRMADEKRDGRTLQHFEGDGILGLKKFDGSAFVDAHLDQADLRVDVSDPTNRYLHSLQLSMPLNSEILGAHSRFRTVSWDGDITLTIQYQAELEE